MSNLHCQSTFGNQKRSHMFSLSALATHEGDIAIVTYHNHQVAPYCWMAYFTELQRPKWVSNCHFGHSSAPKPPFFVSLERHNLHGESSWYSCRGPSNWHTAATKKGRFFLLHLMRILDQNLRSVCLTKKSQFPPNFSKENIKTHAGFVDIFESMGPNNRLKG